MGRYIRLDGAPTAEQMEQLDKADRGTLWLIRKHVNVFSVAHLVQTYGYSKVWLMFEGPVERRGISRVMLPRRRSQFRDGNGLFFRNEILHHPKKLGGIGLVDFQAMIDARMIFTFTTALTGEDESLSRLVADYLVHYYKKYWLRPFCTILAAPTVTTLSRLKGDSVTSSRALAVLHELKLDVQKADIDWDALSPNEVAALPFLNDNYSFYSSTPLDEEQRTYLSFCGISSFGDFLWVHKNTAPRSSDDLLAVLSCPSLYDVKAYMDNKLYNEYFGMSAVFKKRITSAFQALRNKWPSIIQSWPAQLRSKLLAFLITRGLNDAPFRRLPNLHPVVGTSTLVPPWRVLTIAGKPLVTYRPKDGRAFLLPQYVLRPGVDAGRGPDNQHSSVDVWVDVVDPSDEGHVGAVSPRLWRVQLEWQEVWPEVHRYILPGKARQTWWYVLWG